MFRLPEISYPLSVDTIGKMLALGHEAVIHCLTTGCGHAARLDLVALGHRLGFEHSCLVRDIGRYFYCPKCRAAGRDDKRIGMTHLVLSRPHLAWPREREDRRQMKRRRDRLSKVGRRTLRWGAWGRRTGQAESGPPQMQACPIRGTAVNGVIAEADVCRAGKAQSGQPRPGA